VLRAGWTGLLPMAVRVRSATYTAADGATADHGGGGGYECRDCRKVFRRDVALRRHRELSHADDDDHAATGARRYRCQVGAVRNHHHHHHYFICPIIQQYAHTHTFNSPLCRTTQVSWYQKGKTRCVAKGGRVLGPPPPIQSH